MEWNLSESLTVFQDSSKDEYSIEEAESQLSEVTDALALTPEAISRPEIFSSLQDLIHAYPSLEPNLQKQLAYLISSSSNNQAESTYHVVESGEVESFPIYRHYLELYGYLMHCLLTYLGAEDHSGAVSAPGMRKPSPKAVQEWKSNCQQLETAMEAVCTIFKVDLSKLFITTPEKDLYVGLFTRPIYMLMETPERVKVVSVRMYMFKAVCLGVKYHGHASAAQNAIIQNLTYFVHLTGTMAELLQILTEQYDYSQLTEEVLREVSNIEFNANDNNGPKSISEFLVKLSELTPRGVMKQMSSIAQLLDNSNQTLRCSVVEACGNIIIELCKNEEELERHNNQIESLITLLEERFLDQNPYVRTKAIQALSKLCDLDVKFTRKRQTMVELAIRSLEDKSTLVRRNSVRLMSKLVLTHPFAMLHGTQLSLKVWKKRHGDAFSELETLTAKLTKTSSVTNLEPEADSDVEMDEAHDDNQEQEHGQEHEKKRKEIVIEEEDANTNPFETDGAETNADTNETTPNDINAIYKLKLTVQYYNEAIKFIEALHKGTEIASQLLYSKNRNEVLETMDFFVLADAYAIENASEGIRRMLHLIWMKGSSDEGKSIGSHLIDCYRDLFFTAPKNASEIESAAYIAKNLISLTYSASVADLASLEKLLCSMYESDLVSDSVIRVLWQIYNFQQKEYSKKKCRGAIIILGMLALADHEIGLKGLDSLLNIGLGERGKEDLVIARYSCIALQRIVPSAKNNKGDTHFRIARENEAIEKLKSVVLVYSTDPEWYSVAEQAVSAIYNVSTHPDEVCSDIIKEKTMSVFDEPSPGESQVISLSQLLFVVGHVAIKTIVHLEKCETEFKKKKIAAEVERNKEKEKDKDKEAENELEMIGGTSEDDFTDAVIYIKERELLYGEKSLLARFGPLATEICSNNVKYDNETLQRSAVLCMEKLMCVSSKYCEANLILLITIMEKSPDPIIRSNAVLGLGDMAVCFNNLVDENTDFLYRRLTDDNIMVQRTCLMTVTFLILAGQVKVKGQLAQMAKCLENPDQGISDMCRLFFTELATKDNAIYNGFIDIFSGLSNDEMLTKESMKRIVRFLLSFIEKEKHQKQLAEKLLTRLIKSENEEQWNDVAFVLNTLPYKNDSISQTLEEGFKLVSARS